jgi:hypothetical protein
MFMMEVLLGHLPYLILNPQFSMEISQRQCAVFTANPHTTGDLTEVA